jgi:8-oxo-dGTP pyrophosphatase MutT (NUDIX family)
MTQPKFIPADGQVDYTNIRYCPVVHCVVRHGNRILMLQRSPDMTIYPGYWCGVTGFLDDHASVEEKVREEIAEELGLTAAAITAIRVGRIFASEDHQLGKTWIVFPVLVGVTTTEVMTDWEAAAYKWLPLDKIEDLPLLPGFTKVLKALF